MSVSQINSEFSLINPRPEHFEQMQDLCKRVYPFSKPWSIAQLESHRSYFPDGQLIVIENKTGKVVGMAFSLIIVWDDYSSQDSWGDFTSGGTFQNHNPRKGKTLYGAEVMVDPEMRGRGVGKLLYRGRQDLVEKYNLKRIRAGARLRGYSKFKDKLTPHEYVKQVIEKKIYDPTLSFQLNQGFKVIDLAPNYLFNDPESLGYAAVIEWLNPKNNTAKDLERQQQRIDSFLSGQKFAPEFLPRELRRLVRKVTLVLGQIIREQEGEKFYRRIEFYREQLKKTRKVKNKHQLITLLEWLKDENKSDRLKIAHAFSLQLEMVNTCEAAYRTWRQRQMPVAQGLKSKLNLTFVLTAHPTEARSKVNVGHLGDLTNLLVESINNNFIFSDAELFSKIRMVWLQPLSKTKTPTVMDEAEYIYSLIFSPVLFDFILTEKPSYDLKLRTWVGGDKDGHPGVDKTVMKECLKISRKHILGIVNSKIEIVLADLAQLEPFEKWPRSQIEGLKKVIRDLTRIQSVSMGDGTRLKAWAMKYRTFIKGSHVFLKKHNQILLINRILELFPALVFPIELREDSALIKAGLKDSTSVIRGMISELNKISGALGITPYARGLVISHCESEEDISNACSLVYSISRRRDLPVIPLFESKGALVASKKILKTWLSKKSNLELVKRYWGSKLEIMLGYSDSSKQVGVLPSRYLIAKAMVEIENKVKSYGIKPLFFHGSGGSVARGGGSFKEQIAWWANSAIENPKFTVQGEMIQRQFATKEILNSQCMHMAQEALRRKMQKFKYIPSPELEHFVSLIETQYSKLVGDDTLLTQLLDATPYRYLDVLKIGSRPSRRPTKMVSITSLRAIPWVLCWTQTRILLGTWWGIGTAWRALSSDEKKKMIKLFETNTFLSSFVKTLGFSLAKVEIDIWELYFDESQDQKLFKIFRQEFAGAVQFVQDMSGKKDLIWYRPWLEESIRLRAPHIHILNLLQILSMRSSDEALLKETLVGIACGMLTTG